MVIRKADVESDSDRLVSTALASFQADSAVVVDLALIVDDGAPDTVVAHDFGLPVKKVPVGIGHDDPEVVGLAVSVIEVSLPVVPRDDGVRIGPGPGNERGGPVSVATGNIKSHFAAP